MPRPPPSVEWTGGAVSGPAIEFAHGDIVAQGSLAPSTDSNAGYIALRTLEKSEKKRPRYLLEKGVLTQGDHTVSMFVHFPLPSRQLRKAPSTGQHKGTPYARRRYAWHA